MFDADSDYNLI